MSCLVPKRGQTLITGNKLLVLEAQLQHKSNNQLKKNIVLITFGHILKYGNLSAESPTVLRKNFLL